MTKTRWLPKAGQQVCTHHYHIPTSHVHCTHTPCTHTHTHAHTHTHTCTHTHHVHTHTTHTHNAYKGEGHVYAWDEGQGAEAIGKCVRMLAVRCESQAVSSSSSLDGGCRESGVLPIPLPLLNHRLCVCVLG